MEMVFQFLKKGLPFRQNAPTKEEETDERKKKFKNKTLLEILQAEFEEWTDSGVETARIELERIDETEKEMYFSLGDEGFFTVKSPSDYPFTKSAFSLKTQSESLQKWAKQLTLFIEQHSLKSEGETEVMTVEQPPLSLSKLLSHAADTFLADFLDEESEDKSPDKEHGTSDDFNLESDEFNHKLETLALKKKWAQKEVEIRERMKKDEQERVKKKGAPRPSDPLGFSPYHKKKVDQIFTSPAASGVLINDLLNIMEHSEELGFSAEPVDDNIYHWRVKLFGFGSDTVLGQQLKQVKRKFNYDFVELDVNFTIDLYPFYPPLVKLVRPRFQGFMMGRVTCMDILKLSRWDPVKDMKYVLNEIRSMIKEIGKLDVGNAANSIRNYSEGAYTAINLMMKKRRATKRSEELEYLLLRLELLSEQDSRAFVKFHNAKKSNSGVDLKFQEREEIVQAKRRKQEEVERKKVEKSLSSSSVTTFWAKGTGYGHSNYAVDLHKDALKYSLVLQRQQWDVQAFLAAQREKDSQTEEVLQGILQFLNKSSLPPGQFEVLEESCLIPVLETYLRNDSLLDMGRHASLYIAILGVVMAMSKHETLLPLLDSLPFQIASIHDLLKKLKTQAEVFVRRITTASEDEVLEYAMAKDILASFECVTNAVTRHRNKIHEQQTKEVLLKNSSDKQETTEVPAKKDVAEIQKNQKSELKGEVTTDTAKAEDNDDKVFADYQTFLRPLQFDTVSMQDSRGLYVHHYSSQDLGSVISREKILRLAQEQGSLITSLPLTLSSSVFVRVDESRIDIMRALITGPVDTPYDSGCFQFDIFCPQQYPHQAPLVNLQTTGGGSVRFNPNLYNCGKVCLSLLGTWTGAEGETWNKETSTILQVLVSIQSLIFVTSPYFNEPGYERQIGTKNGDEQSRKYNEVIRAATVEHAMVGQLRNPSPGFESVIRSHFYIKQKKILAAVEQWLEEGKGSAAHHSKLKKGYEDLKAEIGKLQPPTLPTEDV